MAGNHYGATLQGGGNNFGVVYAERSKCCTASEGERCVNPYASVVSHKKGSLSSTTAQGGPGDFGTVFRVKE